MAHPRRVAMKAAKNTIQILETVQSLAAEIAELKAEIAELKAVITAKPATTRQTKK
jgi:uncharacterized small protein (DUF1192 family)